ncbi:MAG: hypothetical protein K6A05_04275 [Lachnospiraceae bacterium]|nr:hypothetical protein [Lachnospiraceae bacterium]
MQLSFREKGLSKETKRRILVLTFIFILALIFFGVVLNFRDSEEVSKMSGATMPTISMHALDTKVNELHGYVMEMDACYMRDSVIPLEENRVLPMTIHTYGAEVSEISYEIRSLDTERKIADTTISDFSVDGDEIHVEPVLENLIDEGTEYLLVLKLTCEERPLYYYTRILIPVEAHAKECLDFAKDFHETSMNGDLDSLAVYMETSEYSNKDTLQHVTIESSLSQIGWKTFDGEQVGEPVVELKDISSNYNVIVFYYQMSRNGTGGQTEYYNVEEYFKIRYGEDHMYLLDYHRDMEQILMPSLVKVEDNLITVGVADSSMNYMSNETGSIVAFVQAGSLYEYNQNAKELTEVFSFRGSDLTDSRTNYGEHNIQILHIDESGTLDFVVYGYMNSGSHEGLCGINLYHYDSTEKLAKEQAFIASTKSYQILNAGFSELLYQSTDGKFFIMMDGTLIQVDLMTLENNELLSNMADQQYAVSASGRYIAWMDDAQISTSIHVRDLETGHIYDVHSNAGELLKPLAFMEDDLVYGLVRESDIDADAAGTQIYPMYQVRIIDISGGGSETLKTYEKPGYYVTEVTKQSYTLYLDRVTLEDGVYMDAPQDTIMNSSGELNKAVGIQVDTDEKLGEVISLVMVPLDGNEHVYVVKNAKAGFVLEGSDRIISVEASSAQEKYYVYVGSSVTLATTNVTKAIVTADEEMGIVVDNTQKYIWKRGRSLYRSAFQDIAVGSSDVDADSSSACISAMLVREGENVEVNTLIARGETPITVLQSALKDYYILDLTGCSLSEVLYYVSIGNPVYVRTGDGEALLIIGYDAVNIDVFDPVQNRTYKIGAEDAQEQFAQQGSVYISYIKE